VVRSVFEFSRADCDDYGAGGSGEGQGFRRGLNGWRLKALKTEKMPFPSTYEKLF
jgi:hypothetical protein